MEERELEERLMRFNGHGYDELVSEMIGADEAYKAAKAEASRLYDEFKFVARTVIPRRMDADNVQNITVILPDGSKRQLIILDQVTVKTPADNKMALWGWLRKHGAEHLITETVNSSTLAGYVREQMRQGEDYPNDLLDISTYSTASLRKA